MANKPQTIVISNFAGRLTRIQNGDLNSGFAKYATSFGYDPFTKPMNLTWFEQPTSIASSGDGPLQDAVMGMIALFDSINNVQYVFGIGDSGKLYRIQVNESNPQNPNVDSVIGVTSVLGNYKFGAGMAMFGAIPRLYLGADSAVVSASIVGFAHNTQTANVATNNLVGNIARPLKTFIGKLIFGNGPTFGAVSQTGTVTSSIFTVNTAQGPIYSEINPALNSDMVIRDLDVSTDLTYLLATASTMPTEELTSVPDDRQNAGVSESALYGWNGYDQAITTATQLPSYTASALHTYLQRNMFFSNDAFGASVNNGVEKILSLPNTKSPNPNATASNGNFLTWVTTEVNNTNSSVYGSLFYYGSLDSENPEGLYRVARFNSNLTNGFVYQMPANILVGSKSFGVNNAVTNVNNTGLGKHYISLFNVNNVEGTTGGAGTSKLYRFVLTSTSSSTPQAGVYETQTQLFSKRAGASQIRVYCEPTVAGNGFRLDFIDVDGSVMENGTFTYTYAAGTDITKLQGPLERINFNPSLKTFFGLGVRITNTGTTNMTIKKVEVDVSEEGK